MINIILNNTCVCVLGHFSRVRPFVTVWTVASDPYVHGILQARKLEWVAIPFSRGSSWLRDQAQVSCIAYRFFTVWATMEAPNNTYIDLKYCLIFIPQNSLHESRELINFCFISHQKFYEISKKWCILVFIFISLLSSSIFERLICRKKWSNRQKDKGKNDDLRYYCKINSRVIKFCCCQCKILLKLCWYLSLGKCQFL